MVARKGLAAAPALAAKVIQVLRTPLAHAAEEIAQLRTEVQSTADDIAKSRKEGALKAWREKLEIAAEKGSREAFRMIRADDAPVQRECNIGVGDVLAAHRET